MTVAELEAALPEKALIYRHAGGGWTVRVPPIIEGHGGWYHWIPFKRPRLIDALRDALAYLSPPPLTPEKEQAGE